MAVITISRQVAAHGDEVAARAAEILGYKFVTRKDIEQRIISLGFPENKMPKYDERKPGFFASLAKDRDEYLNYAQMAILEAAAEKNSIIIGRGAFAVLQSVPNNISIRLVADEKIRIQRLKNEFNWTDKQAIQRIQESDTNRAGFHNSFYNVNINDTALFHMVLNTGLLGVEQAAVVVAGVVEKLVTPQDEEKGQKQIELMLQAQKIVNMLITKYLINIEFLHVSIEDNTIILHGIADSTAISEKALNIVQSEMPGYVVKSAISIVQDFKHTTGII